MISSSCFHSHFRCHLYSIWFTIPRHTICLPDHECITRKPVVEDTSIVITGIIRGIKLVINLLLVRGFSDLYLPQFKQSILLYLLSEVLHKIDLGNVEITIIFNEFDHFCIDNIFPCIANILLKGCCYLLDFH